MTAKEQTIIALMEERGLSYGCIMTTIQMISSSKQVQDELLEYLYDSRPSEQEFIEYLADICRF